MKPHRTNQAWEIPFRISEDREAIVRVAILNPRGRRDRRAFKGPMWRRWMARGWIIAVSLEICETAATLAVAPFGDGG